MNLTYFSTMIYAILTSLTKVKNKPNSNPIQSQTNPILGQYQGCSKPNKAKTKPISVLIGMAMIFAK
jgi:hypothetical protein